MTDRQQPSPLPRGDGMTTADVALVLARLEVKLDHLISVSMDHETRLRALELRRWPLPTAIVCSTLSMIGTLGGIWTVR